MSRASLINKYDNRDIIAMMLDLYKKYDTLPDRESLQEFYEIYKELTEQTDKYTQHDREETITAEWSFSVSPIIPNATSPGQPVTLEQISNFTRADRNEHITSSWYFANNAYVDTATESNNPVNLSQLISYTSPFLKPDDRKTITGTWTFNDIRVPIAIANNQPVRLSQLNDLRAIVLGKVSKSSTTDETISTQLLFTKLPKYDNSTFLTSSLLSSYLSDLPSPPQYKGSIETLTTNDLVNKNYVDTEFDKHTVYPTEIPYLANDNTFTANNYFKNKLPRYKSDDETIPTPTSGIESDKAYSDLVPFTYLSSNYVNKSGGTFTGVVDFTNGITVNDKTLDELYINKLTTDAQSLSGMLKVPSLQVNGKDVITTENTYLDYNSTTSRQIKGQIDFTHPITVNGSEVKGLSGVQETMLGLLAAGGILGGFTAYNEYLLKINNMRNVGDLDCTTNYSFCNKTTNTILTNGYSGSYGGGIKRDGPGGLTEVEYLPFFSKSKSENNISYDISSVGVYSGPVSYYPSRYVEGLRTTFQTHGNEKELRRLTVDLGHTIPLIDYQPVNSIYLSPIEYDLRQVNRENFTFTEENIMLGHAASFYWYITAINPAQSIHWVFSRDLFKGNLVPDQEKLVDSNIKHHPAPTLQDVNIQIGSIHYRDAANDELIKQRFSYTGFESSALNKDFFLSEHSKRNKYGTALGEYTWISTYGDSLNALNDISVFGSSLVNEINNSRNVVNDKLTGIHTNHSKYNSFKYTIYADEEEGHTEYPETTTMGVSSETELRHTHDNNRNARLSMNTSLNNVDNDIFTYEALDTEFFESHKCNFTNNFDELWSTLALMSYIFPTDYTVSQQHFKRYNALKCKFNPSEVALNDRVKIEISNYVNVENKESNWIVLEGAPNINNQPGNYTAAMHFSRVDNAHNDTEPPVNFSLMDSYNAEIPIPFRFSYYPNTKAFELSILPDPCHNNKPLIYAYCDGSGHCPSSETKVEISSLVLEDGTKIKNIEIAPEIEKSFATLEKVTTPAGVNNYNVKADRVKVNDELQFNAMMQGIDPTYMGPMVISTKEGEEPNTPAWGIFSSDKEKPREDPDGHLILMPENGKTTGFLNALKIVGASITTVLNPLNYIFGVFKATADKNDDAYLIRSNADIGFNLKYSEAFNVNYTTTQNTSQTLFKIAKETDNRRNLQESTVNENNSVVLLLNEKQDTYSEATPEKAATHKFVMDQIKSAIFGNNENFNKYIDNIIKEKVYDYLASQYVLNSGIEGMYRQYVEDTMSRY